MHILILGATGRTGKLVLLEALKRGHKVNALVSHRSNISIDDNSITFYEGTPLNRYILTDAMRGCDAILSTLNISRTSDFPWAHLRTSKDFLSASMGKILEVAKEQNVNRIIITSAWGVAETKQDVPFWFRWLIDNSNIQFPYMDHEIQEGILKQSDMNWTVVRPVALTNSINQKNLVISFNNVPKPALTIGRQKVADFMLDALEKNLYSRQLPVISEH